VIKKNYMLKKFGKLFVFCLLFSCMKPAQKGIEREKEYRNIVFETDYNDVLKTAQLQHKPIFMDVYTDWCGWCKKLDETTYNDPELIKYFNTNFIPLKVNAEYKQGPGVKLKYNIHSYPRLLFLDSTGKVLLTISGYRTAPKLLEAAKKVSESYIRKG